MNLKIIDVMIFLLFFAFIIGVSMFKSRKEKPAKITSLRAAASIGG